jgi:protein phosphatase
MVSRTDRGLVREINEDSLALFPDQGLVLLADGMGGHNAGEVASRMIIEAVAEQLQRTAFPVTRTNIVQTVGAANSRLLEAVTRQPELEGMATTLVLAQLSGDRLFHAHVGDSRLYLIRGSQIKQLTSDHSMAQEMIDQGVFVSMEEALSAGVPPSVLTRGLGIEEQVVVDVGEMVVNAGDLFLLCSDGLSGMVSDQAILEAIDSSDNNLAQAADRLMELALESGGVDNISLILMRQGNNNLE